MHLIESWGTGIRRILEDCALVGFPEPEFSEVGDALHGPQKRSEMQEFLGLTHREHVGEAVLDPLLEKGFIKLTIPDKPNSSLPRCVKVE